MKSPFLNISKLIRHIIIRSLHRSRSRVRELLLKYKSKSTVWIWFCLGESDDFIHITATKEERPFRMICGYEIEVNFNLYQKEELEAIADRLLKEMEL